VLSGHTAARDLVQLLMNEGDQPVQGRRVALSPRLEQAGDVRCRF
jgi:hypothetical protein